MVHLNFIGLWRGQDGTVSVVTYCGVQTPVDARDFYLLCTCLDWPRGPPILYAMGSGGGSFLGVMWLSVVLTAHPCLVPRLRMNGDIFLCQ
jgi:hypothetical protein